MFVHLYYKDIFLCNHLRDVSTGTTGMIAVAPKLSDTLTLSQSGGADSAHHWHGHT